MNKKKAFLTLGIFAIIYVSIALVNHYYFRTFALDLGAYTNALYDYAHFQWNDSRAFRPIAENLLADHFDVYLILFAPLSWIFKTYTLQIVQLLFILFGGWGVFQFFSIKEETQKLALWAMIWFLSFFGVFSALAYDYHSNVVAAAIVPWFFYYLRKKQNIAAVLVFIAIVIAKENMSLWMAFVALGLIWEYRKQAPQRNLLIGLTVFSFVFFVAVIGWIMPAFSNNGSYPHFHYSALGSSASEAIIHLLSHPIESIKILFINHTSEPLGDFVKMEFFIYLLISGFYLLLRKPMYILMLIPIFFQKMFHDNYLFWCTMGQYSIEFASIMVFGIFGVIAEIKQSNLKKILLIAAVLGNLAVTFRVMDNPLISYDRVRIRFYQKQHYQREFDVKKLKLKLKEIPQEAIVSAQTSIHPHLSWRPSIYQYPNIADAEYIVLTEYEHFYPLDKDETLENIKKLKQDKHWELWYESEGVYIFKLVK